MRNQTRPCRTISIDAHFRELSLLGLRHDLAHLDLDRLSPGLRHASWLAELNWNILHPMARRMSLDELEGLIRILALAEIRYRWNLEGKSGTVCLFAVHRERDANRNNRLYEWLKPHRPNSAFGLVMRGQCEQLSSYVEYHSYLYRFSTRHM